MMCDQDSGGYSPEMVYICCVRGCRNNSRSSSQIFHDFPKDKELRDKWLNAIGCPNWTPRECYRICNEHFHYEQIDYDNSGIKLKDNAVPTIYNFKASEVAACRFCLATGIKMYSIYHTYLSDYMDLIIALNKSNQGLPEYICYLCAPDLIRCKKLIDKSRTSQTIIRDIFTKNGEVTQNLIQAQNRTKLNLQSPLDQYFLIDKYNCYMKCNIGFKPIIIIKNDSKENFGTALKIDPKDESTENEELLTNITEELNETKTVKCDVENVQKINMEISEAQLSSNVEMLDDNLNMNSKPVERPNADDDRQPPQKEKAKPGIQLKWKKNGKGTKFNSIFFDENVAKKQRQKKRQKRNLDSNEPGEKVCKCEVCGKEFSDVEVHRAHVNGHDKVFGNYKCKTCQKHMAKFRAMTFQNELNHTKRFCPKTFNNIDDANNHTTSGNCMGNNNFKPTFVVPEVPIRRPCDEPIFFDA